MLAQNCVLLLIATFISSINCLNKMPDYLHVCHKNDPNQAQCIIDTIYTLKPYLKNGIPEFDSPSLEPLYLGELLVSQSSVSNGLRVSGKNISVFGASDFELDNLKIIKNAFVYEVNIKFKKLHITGIYSLSGQILLLSLEGEGHFESNISDGEGVCRVTFGRTMKDGVEYPNIKKIEIRNLTFKKGSVKMDNLFNGNKVIGDVVNQAINDNFDVFSADLIPITQKALERVIKNIANKIATRFTVKQLLPD